MAEIITLLLSFLLWLQHVPGAPCEPQAGPRVVEASYGVNGGPPAPGAPQGEQDMRWSENPLTCELHGSPR